MGLFGINRLFDDAAKVELMGAAKLPEGIASADRA
jgi:hypothetical protein